MCKKKLQLETFNYGKLKLSIEYLLCFRGLRFQIHAIITCSKTLANETIVFNHDIKNL